MRLGKRTIKVKTTKAKQFFKDVKEIVSVQEYKTFDCAIEVKMKLTFGNRQRHDIDNYQKLTNDSLRGMLWLDDNQIHKITTEKSYSKGNPSTIIEVRPYERMELDRETISQKKKEDSDEEDSKEQKKDRPI